MNDQLTPVDDDIGSIVEPDFPIVTLDDMILHDEVLERYPWLSGHILQRWRRQGSIRSFTGKEGKTVYPMPDLCRALTAELAKSIEPGEMGNDPAPASASRRNSTDSPEAERIRHRQSLASIYGREKAAALFPDD